MEGSLDQPPLILRGARKSGAPLLIVGLLMTLGGAAMIVGPRISTAGIALFLLGLVFFFFGLTAVAAPAQLAIAPGGMELRGALGTRRFRWDQVAAFRVVSLRRGRLIGFDRTGTAGRSGLVRDLAMAFSTANVSSAYDMAIPGAWSSLSAETVAELLNRARAKWGGAPATRALQARPRGSSGRRIDRRLYWLALGVLTGISLLISLVAHGARASGYLTAVSIWIYARRLHDIGRSGWWQAAVFAFQIALAIVLLGALHWSAAALVGPLALVQIGFTLALGAIPGDPSANRFGPPPGTPPLEVQAEAFR